MCCTTHWIKLLVTWCHQSDTATLSRLTPNSPTDAKYLIGRIMARVKWFVQKIYLWLYECCFCFPTCFCWNCFFCCNQVALWKLELSAIIVCATHFCIHFAFDMTYIMSNAKWTQKCTSHDICKPNDLERWRWPDKLAWEHCDDTLYQTDYGLVPLECMPCAQLKIQHHVGRN